MKYKPGQKVFVRYEMASQIADRIIEESICMYEEPFYMLNANERLVLEEQMFDSKNDAIKSLIKSLEGCMQ